MALSHLIDAFGAEGIEKARRLMPHLAEGEARVVARQIERGLNSPPTSSMGRFFDAVAAMLGATPEATYEGQPAMELEAMAGASSCRTGRRVGGKLPSASSGTGPPYPFEIDNSVIDTRPVVRGLVESRERGVDRAEIAARLHETVAAFTLEACRGLVAEGAPSDVVLSGGVMQNARLVARLLELLEDAGLRPHVHREVPPNDAGMSLGQAVVGACSAHG
jgi:hydrogenase maturation protein HypF